MRLFEIMLSNIPIKSPTDNISEVGDANFMTWIDAGNKTLPISQVHGGVNLSDPTERKRVDALKAAISSPDGYISRLIVDHDGNVIEGQHRCEAMRELGFEEIPVRMLIGFDDDNLIDIAVKAQQMHQDKAYSLVNQILGLIHREGSAKLVFDEYEAPRGYDDAWNAVFAYLTNKYPT